jgi:C1A family cysteine protease
MTSLIETFSPIMKDTEYFRHAMLAVGYDDQSKSFIVRNSWGEEWVNNKENIDFEKKNNILG